MSKFLVIFKQEYAQVVKKKSFIIGIFLIPVMMSAFMVIPSLLANKKASEAEKIAVVDRSGMQVGQKFIDAISNYKLEGTDEAYYDVMKFNDIDYNDSALFDSLDADYKQMLTDTEIKYYLVINPEPHHNDTNIYLVTAAENFTTSSRFQYRLSTILSEFRLEEASVNLPVDSIIKLTSRIDLTVKDIKGEVIPFKIKYFTGLVFVMIIYAMIFGYGQIVMRSVIEEKNSRIMEVLLSSVSSFQLMMGKILGLGAATLTQVAIWISIGIGLYFYRADLAMDSGVERMIFDPIIAVSFVIYLCVGYILYSTIFSLLGSIVNNEKESQSFIFPIVMMLMMPVFAGIHIVQEPHSAFSTFVGIFPFTAPTANMMRLIFVVPTLTEISFTSGILLESLISVALLILTTIGMIWITGKVFRVGVLMYGKRPNLPEIMKWIKQK